MNFLVDVNVGVSVVNDLSAAGHDVVYVAAIDKRMQDPDILKNAAAESRVVITIDKDFGKHVFADGLPHTGIIRLPNVRREQRVQMVRKVLEHHSEALQKGAIVTVTKSKIRLRYS
jgi:predicted nuclease of predicted toxin-antitoxin system